MWDLDHKEGWALKNWCFGALVLDKTLESPLDCKEIQPVHPKGDQSWVFIGRTDAEAEVPVLWPHDAKSWLIRKTVILGKIEGRRRSGWQNELVGWHHWLSGHDSAQTPGDTEGQGSLACCSPWCHKESSMGLHNSNLFQSNLCSLPNGSVLVYLLICIHSCTFLQKMHWIEVEGNNPILIHVVWVEWDLLHLRSSLAPSHRN